MCRARLRDALPNSTARKGIASPFALKPLPSICLTNAEPVVKQVLDTYWPLRSRWPNSAMFLVCDGRRTSIELRDLSDALRAVALDLLPPRAARRRNDDWAF